MKTKEERINSMPTLEEVSDRLLTPAEKIEVQNLARAMTAEMRSLQDSVSQAVANYMSQEKIGFNELTRRLETSSRHTSRLLKGDANLTMASIAELAAIMGKHVKVTFE